ncbi:MAG: Gfo/Idh/MocA family oxidoreductase, partial [Prevotellaceae bacterium]|nr:Gfo/Idh/MocA family oxidoreductase [Prevotellaceae bacterium]
MKEISWGFIGCGEVTEKKSGPAFNEVPGSHIEAVMSRSKAHARDYAQRHHIKKWYDDAQELIDDPAVNAVYIATPPSSHATFAIMSMKAGKPCYVEKPLAASYEDCIRINRISEQTGVPCFVAYYRRYLPYFQRVKKIIDDGVIGTVVNVQVRFSVPPRDLDYNRAGELPWRLQPDISGGGYFY